MDNHHHYIGTQAQDIDYIEDDESVSQIGNYFDEGHSCKGTIPQYDGNDISINSLDSFSDNYCEPNKPLNIPIVKTMFRKKDPNDTRRIPALIKVVTDASVLMKKFLCLWVDNQRSPMGATGTF